MYLYRDTYVIIYIQRSTRLGGYGPGFLLIRDIPSKKGKDVNPAIMDESSAMMFPLGVSFRCQSQFQEETFIGGILGSDI